MADDNTALLLQVSADVSRLEKQFAKAQGIVDKGSRAMEGRAKKAAETIERSFAGEGFGKALDKVFDSSRLAVLEEGGAKLRVFGSALEPLGALGIGAAAGVVALTAALHEAHEAVEFADNLFRIAKNAHVTTDELQVFQFALHQAGGNAADAASGLEGFSVQLGKAQAGVPKALNAFRELFGKSFTKDDAKRLADSGQALETVTEKIAALTNNSQKDAIVEQLGLQNLRPLIEVGVDKMREFRAEAQASGNVMDAYLVKRGHEINDEIEKLNGKIKVDMAEAFVNLGPILVKLLGYLADMAGFIDRITGSFAPMEAKSEAALNRQRQALVDRASSPLGKLPLDLHGRTLANHDVELVNEIDAEFARRAALKPDTLPTGAGNLTDVSHHAHHTPHDDTQQRSEQVNEEVARQERAYLEAQKALTDDIEARAEFEKKALDQERVIEQAKIAKQKAELAQDKSKGLGGGADGEHLAALADLVGSDKRITAERKTALLTEISLAKTRRQELNAALDVAAATAASATQAKQDLLQRQTDFAVRKDLIDSSIEYSDQINRQLAAEASITPIARQRADIELEIFKYKQDEARLQYNYNLALLVATKRITEGEARDRIGTFDQTQAIELQAQRRRAFLDVNPVAKYLDGLRDVNYEMQSAGVAAAHNLAAGLADAIVNAHNLGDVAKNVFRQLLQDLLTSAIERDITAPLLRAGGGLFGFPGGGAASAAASAAPQAAAITAASATGASEMGVAVTTAGASAATAMGTAIAAAGATAAAQMAAAIAAGRATGGAGGLLGRLFGFSSAGGFGAGGSSLFDLSTSTGFGLPGFAAGGAISGPGSGTSDSIPALLSAGEFVVNAEAARRHRALLERINAGQGLPRFAAGGLAGAVTLPRLPVLEGIRRLQIPQAPQASGPAAVYQSFDLRGAVVMDELYRNMQAIAAQHAAQALKSANRALPTRQQSLQLLGT